MKKYKKKKSSVLKKWWFWCLLFIVFAISYYFAPIPTIIGILIIAAIIVFIISFSLTYFYAGRFATLKQSIQRYIDDCNDLNNHIEELRSSFVDFRKFDYGEATYRNVSKHKYKHNKVMNAKYAPNVYDCSRQVCDGARKQPFKYICKYFNIKETEESLNQFEEILNNFSAAEEGKELLVDYRESILDSIAYDIPWLIRKLFPKKLERELGFNEFEFDEFYFPVFSFRYISAGGNSGNQYDVVLDMPMLERFVNYLSDKVQFRNSIAGQRQLMTPKLRRYIIERDNYTCQNCGNTTEAEPNLLLEVDHIIPLSRGGMTTVENLQTLCWKCNRHKGAKLF